MIGSSGQHGSIRMMCNADLITYLECTVYMINRVPVYIGYHRLGALPQTCLLANTAMECFMDNLVGDVAMQEITPVRMLVIGYISLGETAEKMQ